MESFVEPHRHPLLAGADTIEAVLEQMAVSEPTFLDPTAKRALLVQLASLEARLAAVRLRTMAVADDAAAVVGARDVAALLTHDTRGDAAEHRRELALAESLDRRWAATLAALVPQESWRRDDSDRHPRARRCRDPAEGGVNIAQAVVITRALDDLPRERIAPEVLAKGRGPPGRRSGTSRSPRAAVAGTEDPRGGRARGLRGRGGPAAGG